MRSLQKYKAKRNFQVTAEPKPRPGKSHHRPIFVVQEHHARRLHYDFRLEADGVLKSWAVPKEPTLDPNVKRLAVHVEDHPLEYAKFHGRIPAGQYGAGEVFIWDRGTFENLMETKPKPLGVTQSVEAGHVEVRLRGRKLKGDFALVRMKGQGGKDNWLMIKMRDGHAEVGAALARTSGNHSAKRSQTRSAPPAKIQLTHGDKVMFPECGVTKAEVFEYYERNAERLLPYLKDRPITLERLPDGIAQGKPHFWQKNAPTYYPDWIPRVSISAENGKKLNYVLIENIETLLYLVNQGTITFHISFSRIENLDRPDFVLFDLDPKEASFKAVISVAQALHEALKAEGIDALVKTSGKSGLHILVPWNLPQAFEAVRGWAMEIARRIVRELPKIATVERNISRRQGRVYIDTLQNARGQLFAPPYVVRPVEPASVATPLRWDEVKPGLDPGRFNVRTIGQRLARQKRDPLAGLLWWT